MLHDVEDILDSWASTGLLEGCPDPFNFALVLETQKRINEKYDTPSCLKHAFSNAILETCWKKPDLFKGLIDFHDCRDVYKLGPLVSCTEQELVQALSMTILALITESHYFGGLVFKNGYLYLIADPIE